MDGWQWPWTLVHSDLRRSSLRWLCWTARSLYHPRPRWKRRSNNSSKQSLIKESTIATCLYWNRISGSIAICWLVLPTSNHCYQPCAACMSSCYDSVTFALRTTAPSTTGWSVTLSGSWLSEESMKTVVEFHQCSNQRDFFLDCSVQLQHRGWRISEVKNNTTERRCGKFYTHDWHLKVKKKKRLKQFHRSAPAWNWLIISKVADPHVNHERGRGHGELMTTTDFNWQTTKYTRMTSQIERSNKTTADEGGMFRRRRVQVSKTDDIQGFPGHLKGSATISTESQWCHHVFQQWVVQVWLHSHETRQQFC